ncbi:NADH-quinone oxidoreductase, subunit M [gamma proteobacterium HdN1]|nr:NADH-quinone oxidoreductase, subunit M [gamma proteobacterium HdN1]
MLLDLIVLLFGGGILAWISGRMDARFPRWVSLIVLLVGLLYLITHWVGADPDLADRALSGIPSGSGVWQFALVADWMPLFGVKFFLAADGLSLALLVLTFGLGIVAVFSAWSEITDRSGFFYFNLLWTLAGVAGIFSALDLLLFFFFWEVMLIPMYFLISLWGHEKREYAALKFFIFTQVSGLLMLLSIIALAFFHYQQTGVITFDYFSLRNTPLPEGVGIWVMLGFFVAFTVKLPSVPFHTWLPDAHTQAPTAGSVLLAGLLLKTGAYGLMRFILPLFPSQAAQFAPIAMLLGVISILYAAKLAFAQLDFKRLIAYTSISHMGFILLGIFSANALAMQGAVIQMLAHGISSSALFAIAGSLQHRLHTRQFSRMGGLAKTMPNTAAMGVFFSIAALGMPGFGNFVGEALVLFGSFQVNPLLTMLATVGMILSPIYALKIIQKVFHANAEAEPIGDALGEQARAEDFRFHERLSMGLMVVAILWLGVHPQPVIRLVEPSISALLVPAPVQVSGLAQQDEWSIGR